MAPGPSEASIVLIGPGGAGKTSVGRRLAEMLGWAFVDLDDLRPAYYAEFGIDHEQERQAHQRNGLAGLIAYWKPFELLSVERVLKEHPHRTVIALGGGQSVYDDEDAILRAEVALAAASRVVLLLPDEDPERALDVLLRRIEDDPDVRADVGDVDRFLEEFRPTVAAQLISMSNRRLATEILVTGAADVDEIARRIETLRCERQH